MGVGEGEVYVYGRSIYTFIQMIVIVSYFKLKKMLIVKT